MLAWNRNFDLPLKEAHSHMSSSLTHSGGLALFLGLLSWLPLRLMCLGGSKIWSCLATVVIRSVAVWEL